MEIGECSTIFLLLLEIFCFSEGKIIPATRNDLICFYNSIYVDAMQNFAVKFRSSVQVSVKKDKFNK